MLEEDIIYVCRLAKKLLMDQPMLLELNGPLKVCGDIHGQYRDMIRLFNLCGWPDQTNYLFLGDYVDRGRQSLETISLLFVYKIKYPNTFFLLRGNHECQAISRIYGFYDECKRRYSVKLWKIFVDVFACLPVAAIIENEIFCCHGGLSPGLLQNDTQTIDDVKQLIHSIVRPVSVPDSGLLCDLLWADPWSVNLPKIVKDKSNLTPAQRVMNGFGPSERGVSYVFSADIVDLFLSRFGLSLIIRAHQVVEDGYEFFANCSLVTVFSAPNYCGEFDNAGGIFCLKRTIIFNRELNEHVVDLEGSFQVLHPEGINAKRMKEK